MSDPLFDAWFSSVLISEGGYQDSPEDPGNWTGGKLGVGTLKGTKYGISAAQYPELDIAALTTEETAAIYRRDWWDKWPWRDLPAKVAIKVANVAVDIGATSAIICLQRALWAAGSHVMEDGILGPVTIGAAKSVNADALLASCKSELAAHYRLVAAANPSASIFLSGWLDRAYG